jgi:hypothetical protein
MYLKLNYKASLGLRRYERDQERGDYPAFPKGKQHGKIDPIHGVHRRWFPEIGILL